MTLTTAFLATALFVPAMPPSEYADSKRTTARVSHTQSKTKDRKTKNMKAMTIRAAIVAALAIASSAFAGEVNRIGGSERKENTMGAAPMATP